MPRTRELQYGRVRQWQDRMSEKKTLADGSQVDMGDPESIRRYVRHAVAMSSAPSIAELKRLEMMLEIADSLPKTDAPASDGGKLRLVDAAQAAEVLRKRLEQK